MMRPSSFWTRGRRLRSGAASRGGSRWLAALFVPILVAASGVQDEAAFSRARAAMVREQIASRGVTDRRVLEAMGSVPRHLFVPGEYRDQAYGDFPLPIGEGQTISQPFVVAVMSGSLGLGKDDKVLEIGTGSGYQAAILARLAGRVFSVEIDRTLADRARDTLSGLGLDNVRVRCGDGFFGWEEEAPFDAVIVTCAVAEVPPRLLDQLAEGGRLILPLGEPAAFQTLTLITKRDGQPAVRKMLDVRFVPMTGEALKRKLPTALIASRENPEPDPDGRRGVRPETPLFPQGEAGGLNPTFRESGRGPCSGSRPCEASCPRQPHLLRSQPALPLTGVRGRART